eukprot:CAMPEP_0116974010 /NCGR_PEP_ID=MMETSP0467-20121206/54879_1 /TAXON_ID=283647 /ORGANISM="Mesodinium pulex, Strain SPMC105" /LENGTH=228 /DNA_ID=CAMNT_0004666003 /DNA_START=540 /DNA_END=1225 /DNA_ORIENTATION=-
MTAVAPLQLVVVPAPLLLHAQHQQLHAENSQHLQDGQGGGLPRLVHCQLYPVGQPKQDPPPLQAECVDQVGPVFTVDHLQPRLVHQNRQFLHECDSAFLLDVAVYNQLQHQYAVEQDEEDDGQSQQQCGPVDVFLHGGQHDQHEGEYLGSELEQAHHGHELLDEDQTELRGVAHVLFDHLKGHLLGCNLLEHEQESHNKSEVPVAAPSKHIDHKEQLRPPQGPSRSDQ